MHPLLVGNTRFEYTYILKLLFTVVQCTLQYNMISTVKHIYFFYFSTGLAMLLPRCMVVNMFEFIPSERMTHRCHYYHEKVDVTCTFGIWHPLAAEKLLMLAANTMSDQTVFHTGFMSIPGYRSPLCTL